jgi:hypothetical protein
MGIFILIEKKVRFLNEKKVFIDFNFFIVACADDGWMQ